MIQRVQLYDDSLDFVENREQGPFGDYADSSDAYENKGEPQYDFFGTPVYSPFGIGAGPLPTAKFIGAALGKGYDIVSLKSVRTSSFPLNPFPQVRPVLVDGNLKPGQKIEVADEYSSDIAVANSFGIPSVPPEQWQPVVRESLALAGKGQVVVVPFQGTARGDGQEAFVQDHVRGIELIKECGGSIIEINLSCPNEGEDSLACFDTTVTTSICRAVREAHPDITFFIKLAYFEDKQALRGLVEATVEYVDGYSAINTVPAEVIDADGNEAFPGRPTAGISGAPVKWAGLEMCKALDTIRSDLDANYKIVSMGGVLNAEDFNEYREAGADIVMSVTGAMWNPNLAREIKDSLR